MNLMGEETLWISTILVRYSVYCTYPQKLLFLSPSGAIWNYTWQAHAYFDAVACKQTLAARSKNSYKYLATNSYPYLVVSGLGNLLMQAQYHRRLEIHTRFSLFLPRMTVTTTLRPYVEQNLSLIYRCLFYAMFSIQ